MAKREREGVGNLKCDGKVERVNVLVATIATAMCDHWKPPRGLVSLTRQTDGPMSFRTCKSSLECTYNVCAYIYIFI